MAEEKVGFFKRLVNGLTKTRDSIVAGIDSIFSGYSNIDDDFYEEIEEILVMGDIGINTTTKIIDHLKERVAEEHITDPAECKQLLIESIKKQMDVGDTAYEFENRKSVVLVIGVNGVGKTTSVGKLAGLLKDQGKKVVLAAADTFRAAAGEQLTEWAHRAGVDIIGGQNGADPASIVYDAVAAAKARNADVLICDTAGRLHNKKNLMEELHKIYRILEKEYPEAYLETLVVLDGTTGQNALQQARQFAEVANVTGIILTKLDGTAKGGIAVAIQSELDIPVKYIGVGESIHDLQKFDADQFVNALFHTSEENVFLLPFAAAATVIVAVVLAGKRRWKALAAQVIPYVMLGVGVLTFCTLNYTHYGVFALSDFSEGSFAAAMGAMMRVDTDSTAPYLSVPADAREKIYDAVPELEPLAYWLEEDAQLQNDFRDPNLDDYRAGSFYWAIRRAAQFEGIYADAKTADAYWQTVADKINAACDAGTLPSRTGRRVATSQPISAAYVPATLAETWNGFWHVLGLRDCAPYETLRSIGTEDDFTAWSGYLHCGFNSAANAGEDTPYYSPYQKTVFAVMQGWTRVCSILLTVGVLCAVLCQLAELLPQRRQKCTAQTVVPWLLLFGIFGIALLRCAMIAFVEVSSFGIGTSTMYLATVHPLLVLYAFAGMLLYGRPRKTDKRRENA